MLDVLKKELNVAIYCRLSREDGDSGESNSIKTQREILVDYVEKNNWNIYNIYADDGYSGGNFNRPGWKRLINDVESGLINIVIVKDLSRLGRNYIETGYYTEEYFPNKNVRFIAVNDNYDSEKEDNELTPFMNIINQWYLRDLSKKIKASHQNRMKKGVYPKNLPIPFYGFKFNEKNERVVCEETAMVVRKIFEMYVTSLSPVKIVEYLFENKIPTPAYYNYLTYGYNPKEWINAPEDKKYRWHKNIIVKIIKSEEYIGSVVLNKRSTISYKTHKRVRTANEKRYIFENMTEGIVDEATFNRAQEIRLNRIFQTIPLDINRYKNIIYCADCGKPLSLKHTRAYPEHRTKESYSYACRKNKNNNCSNRQSVRMEFVDKLVYFEIEKLIDRVLKEKDEIRKYAIYYQKNHKKKSNPFDDTELEKLIARNKKLDILMQRLYEKQEESGLPKETYNRMMNSYSSEYEENKLKIEELKKKKEKMNQGVDYIQATEGFIKRIENVVGQEINRNVILSVVEKIFIMKVDNECKLKICIFDIPDMLEEYFYGK